MTERTGVYYLRKSISVDAMSREESVKYQHMEIERYCNEHQINLIKGFSDVGYSGSNTNRPELQEMLSFLRSSEVRVTDLVIFSIDRFGRDLRGNITVVNDILNHVDRVVFIREATTSDSEGFKLTFTLLTAVAQQSRIQIKRNLAAGRKAKVLFYKNQHGAITPLGFTRLGKRLVAATEINTTNRVEIQGLEIVRHIFYQYLMGDSLAQIAKSLNELYGPTRKGKKWGHTSVRWILSSPIYLGTLRGSLDSESYCVEDANVQKLIDPGAFEIIQQRLENEGKGRPIKGPLSRNPHFTLCIDCGTMLKKKKNELMCPSCNRSVSLEIIHRTLIDETLKLLQDSYECHLDKNALIDTLRNKKIANLSQQARIYEAIQNTAIAEGVPVDEKNEMYLEANNELDKTSRELLLVEELINFLTEKPLKELLSSYSLQEDLLLKLPYLILVNFVLNQIYVVFHKEVFISD